MKKSSIWLRFFCATLLVLFCVTGFFSRAAFAQQGQTSMGTDFWVGFMPNYILEANNIGLYIGSGTDNEVWVDAYDGSPTPVEHYHQTLTANSLWTVYAKSTHEWTSWNTETPDYRAIHVYSKNPIVLYGIDQESLTTDSYLAIATAGLGTDYRSSCYYDDVYTLGSPGTLAGEFLVVAPFDNTVVTIGPVKTPTRASTPTPLNPDGQTVLHQRGDTWSVTLMKGQTYLVQSTGLAYGDDDLTGTHIVSTHPVGLLSGHVRASIPIGELAASNGSKNHLLEMIPSTDKWGSQYYDMPMAGRTVCGDLVRVIAGEDNELITANSVSGAPTATLVHAGDFYDFELVTDPTVFSEKNGKKFLAVQMSYSQGYDGDPGVADPFAIVLTSQSQFQKKLIFRTPDNRSGEGFTHYATFICQTDSIQKIRINGQSIGSFTPVGQAPIPGTTPPMSAMRIKLPSAASTYVATSGASFGCYLYGFSTDDAYGHPAGMALRTISPDTLPPLEKVDTDCGDYQVKLMEPRHIPAFSFDDTRISDFAMITDTLDPRWPKRSYNYAFAIDPAHPFTPGDSVAYFTLTVLNHGQDAYAAVWTTDRAGNDTVYQYAYTAPKIQASPLPFSIEPVRVTMDSCENIFFKNTEAGILHISSDSIMGLDTSGKFTISPTTIDKDLAPGDSIEFQLCFSPSDTVISSDTLLLGVGCSQFKYSLAGLGVTPLIIASDVNFGNISVGNTSAPQPVKIRNVGTAALTITTGSQLINSTDFTFSDASLLPFTLKPGESKNVNFTFHPSATGPFQTVENWGTDLPTPFAHQIKDTSQLLGYGVQGGLNWDRPTQGYWTECSNPVIDTVNLINPTSGGAGQTINVATIKITGTDADEFSIVGYGGVGAPPFRIPENGGVPVYLEFTPNLTKGYVGRNAQIVAYSDTVGGQWFTPSIALTGTVRHATIRITPPTYDFGTVQPGTPVTTNLWIHNDGDTVLLLSSLTIDNGFTLTGFTPGEQVLPGDSVMVTVSDVAQVGTTTANLSASTTVDVPCTPGSSAPITITSTSFITAATGHNYGNVYVCQNGSAVVTASDSGSKDALLTSVRILDSLGSNGASQYSFANGTKTIDTSLQLQHGQSVNLTVNFNPVIGGGTSAYIAYTFVDQSTLKDTVIYQVLQGNPLHYTNTLSVQNGSPTTVYSAYPSQAIDVPIHMLNNTLDANANIYKIQFTLRYKRDMFILNGVVDGNLNPVTSDTTTDPTDPSYILNTVTISSNTPITLDDSTIAHLQLEYVLSKDSISQIQVMNPVYLEQDGTSVCWVSHDTIPSVFAGLDRCGDPTLHTLLTGGVVSFRINQISPNPVSEHANIGYNVHLSGVPLTMEIYNILGQKVETIMDGEAVAEGDHSMTIETTRLPAGQYILRLSDGTTVDSRPFVVQK